MHPLAFVGRPLLIVSLFASSPGYNHQPSPSSNDTRLTFAQEASAQAAELASEGCHEEAAPHFEDALTLGRKAALKLHEEGGEKGTGALDWLIGVFRASATNRLRLHDVDGARRDAWAACVFSQSANVAALECLAEVCEASDDIIGHCQALKQILELQPVDEGGIGSEEAERRLSIQRRIAELEDMLKDMLK